MNEKCSVVATAITTQLPNGFHNAVLRELHVDFAKQEVRLDFQFWVGHPDAETEEGREAMRPGMLRLTGVVSMRIEPPDPRYQFATARGVTVDGDFGVYPGEPEVAEDGVLRLCFYSSTWNSRMILDERVAAGREEVALTRYGYQ